MRDNSVSNAAVSWPLVLSVLNGVLGVVFAIAWPDLEERGTVIPVSIVLGSLIIGAVLWWRTGARWGRIAVIVVNSINILLAAPAFFTDQDGSFMLAAGVSVALSAAVIAFVLRPPARVAA